MLVQAFPPRVGDLYHPEQFPIATLMRNIAREGISRDTSLPSYE